MHTERLGGKFETFTSSAECGVQSQLQCNINLNHQVLVPLVGYCPHFYIYCEFRAPDNLLSLISTTTLDKH